MSICPTVKRSYSNCSFHNFHCHIFTLLHLRGESKWMQKEEEKKERVLPVWVITSHNCNHVTLSNCLWLRQLFCHLWGVTVIRCITHGKEQTVENNSHCHPFTLVHFNTVVMSQCLTFIVSECHIVKFWYCHIATMSHYDSVSVSHCHNVKVAQCHTFVLSHCHAVTQTHCHTAAISHCYSVTLSHCHTVTLTYCHTV